MRMPFKIPGLAISKPLEEQISREQGYAERRRNIKRTQLETRGFFRKLKRVNEKHDKLTRPL